MTTAERFSRPGIHQHNPRSASDAERDPVCGMTVDAATAKHRTEHAGHAYYFCSSRCREKFEADPARYSTPRPEPAGPVTEGGRVDLPDAPGDPARRAGQLPDLRHGARTDVAGRRRGPIPSCAT